MKKLPNTLTVAFLLLSMLLLSGCNNLGDATRVDKVFTIDNNGSISIDLNVVDVSVGLSTDNEVHITYYEYDLVKYEINANENSLVLTQHIDDKLNDSGRIIPITIDIPKVFIGQFNIKDNVGNITVGSIKAESINLKSNVGDVKLSEQGTEEKISIIIKSNVGDITAESIDAESIDLSSNTGDITGSIVGSQNDFAITSSTGVGDNNLPNGTTGTKILNVTTKVGDIDISFK